MLRVIGNSLRLQLSHKHKHISNQSHSSHILKLRSSATTSHLTGLYHSRYLHMASSDPTSTTEDSAQQDASQTGASADLGLKETVVEKETESKDDTGGGDRKGEKEDVVSSTNTSKIETDTAGVETEKEGGKKEATPPLDSCSGADSSTMSSPDSTNMTKKTEESEKVKEENKELDKEASEKTGQSKDIGMEKGSKKTSENKETKASAQKSPTSSTIPWLFNRSFTSPVETREYFENMSLEEKRKLYSCGSKYNRLEQIETWTAFQSANKCSSQRTLKNPKNPNAAINSKVSLWRGDITCLEIDAIVNAANTTLMGGGGVDGAIHDAAGRSLRRECRELDGCSTGYAKLSGGHRLPAKYIIHTVGPIGEKRDQLTSCYRRCLQLVEQHKIKSIAFCCISTGIYGYSNINAAVVALGAVRDWLETNYYARTELERVIFCVFLKVDYEIYSELMCLFFPIPPPADPSPPPLPDSAEINQGKEREEKEGTPPVEENKETGASPAQPATGIPPLTASVTAPAALIRQAMGTKEEGGETAGGDVKGECPPGEEGADGGTEAREKPMLEGEGGNTTAELEREEPNAKQPKLEAGSSDTATTESADDGVKEGADGATPPVPGQEAGDKLKSKEV